MQYTECVWLKELTTKGAGQALQCGQVLDLQVICPDVALLDSVVIEFTEEFFEHVVDTDPCENVALLNFGVQALWDVLFVTGGIRTEKCLT